MFFTMTVSPHSVASLWKPTAVHESTLNRVSPTPASSRYMKKRAVEWSIPAPSATPSSCSALSG